MCFIFLSGNQTLKKKNRLVKFFYERSLFRNWFVAASVRALHVYTHVCVGGCLRACVCHEINFTSVFHGQTVQQIKRAILALSNSCAKWKFERNGTE